MTERGIKECPNNCGRFCLPTSNQCSGCLEEIREERRAERDREREERKEWLDSLPLQQCKAKGRQKPDGSYEWECKNQTKFALCRECYQVEKQYTINRRAGRP
jgi:hypothetical protein